MTPKVETPSGSMPAGRIRAGRTLALTGATGFVGGAVLDAGIRAGCGIRALTRRDQPAREGVGWVRGDLADRAALADLVAGADAVLHVAGVVNTPDPAGFHAGNVAGTQALLDAARDAGVARFVFVSSLAAREPALSEYGRSKHLAEELVRTSGLDWTIVRPPAIYGPRDRDMLELFRLARWRVVPMPPPGRTSVIHVADLADLLIALSAEHAPTQRMFEVDDGTPGGWSHRELAHAIGHAVTGGGVWSPAMPAPVLRAMARLDRIVRGGGARLTPDRVGYMTHPDWVCRGERAPPETLWRARVPTGQGLADTARWYRREGWL